MARKPQQPKQNAGLNAFAQALKTAAENKRAQLAEQQAEEVEEEQPEFLISKPHSQDVGTSVIKWTWKSALATVEAWYCREAPNVHNRTPGEYWVTWEFNNHLGAELTPPELKHFTETLLSAYRWADVWEDNMGEFFRAKLNGPELVVVQDDDDDEDYDAFDVDDNGDD
jgi:hypothetical protein